MLKKNTLAPLFKTRDIYTNEVDLKDYRNKKVMLSIASHFSGSSILGTPEIILQKNVGAIQC